jgi:hypothetical protein
MNPLNYATLEACQRLQAAGIVLETDCFYRIGDGWDLCDYDHHDAEYRDIPAPSMAEVWRVLPESVCWRNQWRHLTVEKIGDLTSCYYRTNGIPSNEINPTDALIDLLIWVMGQGKEKVPICDDDGPDQDEDLDCAASGPDHNWDH